MKRVEVFTDGACKGNPGPGGWGAILTYGDKCRELSGGEALTTNNRMELMAAIAALEALRRPSRVELFTDSNYVKSGITAWINGWKRNGWRTADKKPVKNDDLWRKLEEEQSLEALVDVHAVANAREDARQEHERPGDAGTGDRRVSVVDHGHDPVHGDHLARVRLGRTLRSRGATVEEDQRGRYPDRVTMHGFTTATRAVRSPAAR